MWYIIPKDQANELYHHGIKGQKWGVRNGPPYPLEQKPTGRAANTAQHNGDQNTILRKIDNYLLDVNGLATLGATIGSYESIEKAVESLPPERRMNCGACTLAGIRSWLGTKTTAKQDWLKYDPTDDEYEEGLSKGLFKLMMRYAAKTESKPQTVEQILDYIRERPDGSTGALYLPLDDASGECAYPHWVQWFKMNDKIGIVDNQLGARTGVKNYIENHGYYSLLHGIESLGENLYGSELGACAIYTVTDKDFNDNVLVDFFINR